MSARPDGSAAAPSRLCESLLHGAAVAAERRPESRWAYRLGGILLVSVFVLYHASILIVWNAPHKGLAKPFHSTFLNKTKGYPYFKGTRNTQSWAMFAPNPTRTNNFVQVYVRDQDGQDWDFEQDIWELNRYPYIWYDRRGKVNRRIDGKKGFQRIYGAWVCREWERIYAGTPAVSVTFIRRITKIPDARVVIENGGWDQWKAPFKQVEQETIHCKTIPEGTLPNALRERYGLEPIDEAEVFIPVRQKTWWTEIERQRKREQVQAERDARQAAARERWDSRVEPGTEPASDDDESPDQ
jgi:hypothetical protein